MTRFTWAPSIIAAVALAGCATGGGRSSSGPDRESLLLIHLIADADSTMSGPGVPILIDPRPLADVMVQGPEGFSAFAESNDSALRSRADSILRAGADTASGSRWAKCPGRLAPGVSRAACPDSAMVIVALGTPSQTDADSSSVVKVRLQRTELGMNGKAVYGYRYSVVWEYDEWHTIKREFIWIAE